MKKLLFILILSLIACNIVFADVQSSRDSGLNWLLSHQNPDGSFGNQTDPMFRDTEEVLITLNILNQKASQYQNGLQWIINNNANNIDFVARKITVLSSEGIDTTAGINKLLSNQNTDGGWGLAVYESDSLDTALVIQALKSINYSNQTVIQSALNYLVSTQNTDGGWGFYQGDDSNVYMTAVVSITLQQFSMTVSLANSVNKATDYLRLHQNADGGFGSSASTVYETSLAYIALVGVTTDNTILNNAINYLTTNQMPNGSWNDDPYSTALALRALYFSENKPVSPPQPPTEIIPPVIEPLPSDTTITGKVTDASTGNPITDAEVIITDTGIFTRTDSTGTYTITGITQLEFNLKVFATSYDSRTFNVKTTTYGICTIDLNLNLSQVSNIKIISLATDKQTYPVGSPVVISAALMNLGNIASDVVVSAKIINQQGIVLDVLYNNQSWITVNPQGSENVSLEWNIAQQLPGIYKIILTVDSFAQGILLDQQEISFSIEPTFALTNAALSVSPTFTYNGKTETVKLSSLVSYASNIPVDVQAVYMFKDSQNNVLDQGSILVSLPIGGGTVNREIAQITYTFTTGQYTFSVVFSRNGTVLKELTTAFTTLSNIHINTQRSVTPTTVLPEANGKVKITIELKGVEQ